MLHRLIQVGNAFFAKEWRIMAYQPVLYLFIFGASIRLALNKTAPISFDSVFGDGVYEMWLFMGIASPLASLLSWYFVKKCTGRSTFLGFWLRLSSDIGIFTVIVAYHITSVITNPINESRIFSRYIVGSALFMCILWIVRDFWTLFLTERLANKIHSGNDE